MYEKIILLHLETKPQILDISLSPAIIVFVFSRGKFSKAVHCTTYCSKTFTKNEHIAQTITLETYVSYKTFSFRASAPKALKTFFS